jgi:hypothetical protein
MKLVYVVMEESGSEVTERLGAGFGLEKEQVRAAMQHLIPALGAGLQRNLSGRGGLANLMRALAEGGHSRYLEHPELLDEPETAEDGNKILDHVLGGAEARHEVAELASAETAIETNVLEGLLPLAAALTMGALGKESANLGILGGGNTPAQPQKLLQMLAPLLMIDKSDPSAEGTDMMARYLRNR